MQCDCIKGIEKKILDMEKWQGKTIEKVEFVSKALIFSNPLEVLTTSEIEIKVEGRKSSLKQSIMHTYCPFCGVKTKKEETVKGNTGE